LNIDSDLGRHLTIGRYILSSHEIPTHDLLSFTKPGESRPPYEWLAQVLFALLYEALGLDGVVLLTCIAIAAAFSVVYLDCVRRSDAPIFSLLITAWAAVASSLHWLPRPHIFSFLFFAVWVSWLERLRRGERLQMWLFPALMLVWSNMHGGFVFGFLALGAYLAGWILESVRGRADRNIGSRLLMAGVISGVASVLTPDLWRNWEAVLNNRSSYVISRTVETMPLQIATRGGWPFLGLLTLAMILLGARRLRSPAGHIFLLVGLTVASFVVIRNIPFFAIAAAPILCEWGSTLLNKIRDWHHIEARIQELEAGFQPFVWSSVFVLVVVCALGYREITHRPPIFGFRSDVLPVKAADWLSLHPQNGRMFNDFNWGGYLLFRLWPEQKVFIDSQSDFYGEPLTRQADSIAAGEPGWETALDGFGIDWIIVPHNAGLVPAALATPDWHVAYQDGIATILVHK
jgi:hypothetical protein